MTLGQASSGEGAQRPPTVEDPILGHLLPDVPETTLWDLVTCAAAGEQRHALALADQEGLLVGGQTNCVEVLDPILWPPGDAAGPALPRRLLRRRLVRAVRVRDSSGRWGVRRINESVPPDSSNPQIKLVLANQGDTDSQWQPVADQGVRQQPGRPRAADAAPDRAAPTPTIHRGVHSPSQPRQIRHRHAQCLLGETRRCLPCGPESGSRRFSAVTGGQAVPQYPVDRSDRWG